MRELKNASWLDLCCDYRRKRGLLRARVRPLSCASKKAIRAACRSRPSGCERICTKTTDVTVSVIGFLRACDTRTGVSGGHHKSRTRIFMHTGSSAGIPIRLTIPICSDLITN